MTNPILRGLDLPPVVANHTLPLDLRLRAEQQAADEWVRMIFGNHVQNNGDQSDAGGLAMALGTLAKDKASSGYGKDVIDKFRSLMADHYRNGCRWKSERGTEYRDVPDVCTTE